MRMTISILVSNVKICLGFSKKYITANEKAIIVELLSDCNTMLGIVK